MPTTERAGFDRRKIAGTTAAIAMPLVAQNVISYFVNMLDTLMLGQLGEIPLSAASLGNQVFFIVTLVAAGVAGGSNVLAAQFWGRRDIDSIHRVLAYTYRTALIFALAITAAGVFFPRQIMLLFTNDAEIVAKGTGYLRITAVSYLFYTISTVTTGVLQAVHTVKIAMAGSLLALTVKAVLNLGLIFGHFGMPRLGITGAALATVTARACEFCLIIWFVYRHEGKLKIRMYKMLQLDRSVARPYFITSVPVVCNELFWALGSSVLSMVLGHMGREVITANSIYGTVSQLSDVTVSGITSAACVLVANAVGAGDNELLEFQKRYFQRLSVKVGLLVATIMLAARPVVVNFYHVSGPTKSYAEQIMLVGAGIAFFSAMQIMNMMGILRGGGDVKFAMANDLFFLWLVMAPLGYMTAFIWKLPVPVVFFCIKSDQIIKLFTSGARIRSGKWKRNLTAATRQKQHAKGTM